VFIGYSGKYTITPESYYADIRSKSTAIHSMIGHLGGIITTFIAGTLMYYDLFLLVVTMYAGVLILAGIAACFVRETRGLDIDSHLNLSGTKQL
jgi:hypothetical protein